ncbi:MAG: hypothetical protein ABTQ73_08240, partial [Caldilineales bacterium]
GLACTRTPARFSGRRFVAGGISSPGDAAAAAGRSIVRLRRSAPSTGLAGTRTPARFSGRRFVARGLHPPALPRRCTPLIHAAPPSAGGNRRAHGSVATSALLRCRSAAQRLEQRHRRG